MRAITVIPGKHGSVALTEMPEPPESDGPILVRTQAIGICGTDLEIINGEYGTAPPGEDRLIIGHESLGRVIEAAPGTGFSAGDLVVGIVRRRDPVPCPACAAGHWDMCTNGQYTERGIKGRHGYASERYRIHPDYLVAVDPALGIRGVLLEPATVVAKAWDHIEKIGHRAAWAPQKVLITGAGPIGLLAALLSVQHGYQTYVLDLVTEGRKPEMVRRLGATYFHRGNLNEAAAEADIVLECTGHLQMLLEAGPQHARYRITCLTGVSAAGAEATVDPGLLNRNMVLQNSVIFGSVNANRQHYELAAKALAQADPGWLAGLITREVPLEEWQDAYTRRPDDIKATLNFSPALPFADLWAVLLVRDMRDDTGRGQAVQDQLHGDRSDQEAEDLLDDQHAVLIQLLTHPVRPAEHRHIYQQDEHQDAELHGQNAQRLGLSRDRHQADDAHRVQQVRHRQRELRKLHRVFPGGAVAAAVRRPEHHPHREHEQDHAAGDR
jgi:threonine dehydrogenase-like Zn-dependent dehydrogenase